MKRVLIVVAVLIGAAFAQDRELINAKNAEKEVTPKVAVPVLSAQKQLELRNLQVVALQAHAADDADLQQYLQNSPKHQAALNADADLQNAVVVTKRELGIDERTRHLCDGPDNGVCKDVKVGELAAREIPVQQAKK